MTYPQQPHESGDLADHPYAGPHYAAPVPTGPQTRQHHPFGPGEPLSTKGFFGKLFDLSFTSYITPSIVTIVYILTIVAVVFGWLAATVVAWSMNAAFGVLTLIILGPVYALFALVLMRITLEFYVAVIRIAQDVKAVRERP